MNPTRRSTAGPCRSEPGAPLSRGPRGRPLQRAHSAFSDGLRLQPLPWLPYPPLRACRVAVAILVAGPWTIGPTDLRGQYAPRTTEVGTTVHASAAIQGSATRAIGSPERDPVPTAARDLPRGITLTEADINRPEGTADSTPAADGVGEGWVTRRVIAAGEPLRPPSVAPPSWTKAGDPVDVRYRVGSAEVLVRGTAMGTAAKGERILVRIDARRRVEGVVIAPGVVQLQGGTR